jgi:hypothetical protein
MLDADKLSSLSSDYYYVTHYHPSSGLKKLLLTDGIGVNEKPIAFRTGRTALENPPEIPSRLFRSLNKLGT